MKLKWLRIARLPGIDQPFEIESPGPGVHVIFGPNAIGKSSICRAVEAVYWADRGPTERISVSAQFELDGEEWRAEREDSRLRWRIRRRRQGTSGISSLPQPTLFLSLFAGSDRSVLRQHAGHCLGNQAPDIRRLRFASDRGR